MKRIIKWSEREFSFNKRFLATISAGMLFLFLIPVLLTRGLPTFDKMIGLPSFSFGIINVVIGGIMVLIGATYALWSIISQLTRAKGTPLPMMATQKLLIDGPFKHSRNPMGFGAICMYLGMSIIVGSLSSVIVVLFFLFLLVFWIKKVEEKELEIRFGQDYKEYIKNTPFMIPRPWRK
ncbi:MAG TPA: isoprenylcysteine carboxylmethyltransferase family protein [Anaerolineaceae bacterium]|nr:isoprenylcysteine carboxylmethyltransferase family protein [Anaerolineaceae bacterium]